MILALDLQLRHDHHVLGVNGPVGDPVLLRQRVRRVYDEFFNKKNGTLH
jgi:hypothetical protein